VSFLKRPSFWLPVVLLTSLAAVMCVPLARRRGELAELRKREAESLAELIALRRQELELRKEREALLTDPAAIERAAREHYGLAGRGELAIPWPSSPKAERPAPERLLRKDGWEAVLGEGGFPWPVPAAVFALSVLVLGAFEAASGQRGHRTVR